MSIVKSKKSSIIKPMLPEFDKEFDRQNQEMQYILMICTYLNLDIRTSSVIGFIDYVTEQGTTGTTAFESLDPNAERLMQNLASQIIQAKNLDTDLADTLVGIVADVTNLYENPEFLAKYWQLYNKILIHAHISQNALLN